MLEHFTYILQHAKQTTTKKTLLQRKKTHQYCYFNISHPGWTEPGRCMLTHAYKIHTSEILKTEFKVYCQPSGEFLSTKTTVDLVHFLLIYKIQVFPLLSTALWHYQTLFNILLSGNILLNHGLSLPSAGVQLSWAARLPPEGSLEDSADPPEGHTWHQQAEVLTLSDWRRTDVEIAHTRINTSHRLPHGKKQTHTEQPSSQIQWNTDI